MTLTVWVLGGGCYAAHVLDEHGNLVAAFAGPAAWVLEHLPHALAEPASVRKLAPPIVVASDREGMN
jgi:hypothetical protein